MLFQWGFREELQKRGMSGLLDTTLFYSGTSHVYHLYSRSMHDRQCVHAGEPEEFLGEHHYAQDILHESGGGEWVFMSVRSASLSHLSYLPRG